MRESSSSAKNNQYFQIEHLKANLKNHSVREANLRNHSVREGIILAAQAYKFWFVFSNMVLARLLTLPGFGLIGMVATATGSVALFEDLELSMAPV